MESEDGIRTSWKGLAAAERQSNSSDTTTASLQSHVNEILDSARSGVDEDEGSSRVRVAQAESALRRDFVGTKQQIILTGSDSRNSYPVYGQNVFVSASAASGSDDHLSGSNKVKVAPIVNHDWEHRFYFGRLVAVHRSGLFVAYVLKGKDAGVVRVYHRLTTERCLLKGYRGMVVDIAFARLHTVLLGSVDEEGNMLIYEIQTGGDSKLNPVLVLHVQNSNVGLPSSIHRLIWCPFIPEDGDSTNATSITTDSATSDDMGRLLALTHDSTVELWHVEMVYKELGSGPLRSADVNNSQGHFVIPGQTADSHSKAITDAAFSPDGTALATASLDGDVRFFQVNLQENSSRCLHKWSPHDGKPVTRLFFLDDHKHANAETLFWKFAVTAASYNQEVKIWACQSWACLQTISLLPESVATQPSPSRLQLELDLSATYMVMSDIQRRVLYVMQLHQDTQADRVHVCSFSEFVLAQPYISLAILDATRRKFKRTVDDGEMDNLSHGDDEGEEVMGTRLSALSGQDTALRTVVKLVAMHPRGLQDLIIDFRAESIVPLHPPQSVASSSVEDGEGVADMLSDVSMEDSVAEVLASTNGHHDHRSHPVPQSVVEDQPVLLTPDAFFSSPGTRPNVVDTHGSSGSSLSSFTHVSTMDDRDNSRVVPVVPSPGSSITVTPSSSRDFFAQGSPQQSLLTSAGIKNLSPVTRSFPAAPAPPRTDHQSPLVLSAPLTAADFLTSPLGLTSPLSSSSQAHASLPATIVTSTTSRPLHRSSLESLEVKHILENGGGEGAAAASDWPQAPDVAGQEAKRLVADTIEQVTAAQPSDESERDDEMHEYDEDDEDVSDREGIASNSGQLWKEQRATLVREAAVEGAKAACRDTLAEVMTTLSQLTSTVQLLTTRLERMSEQQQQQRGNGGAESERLRLSEEEVGRQRQVHSDIVALRTKVDALPKQLSATVQQQSHTDVQRIQKLLMDSESREAQRLDKMAVSVTQTVERTITGKLEKMVHDQVRDVIAPGVARALEPLKDQLHVEIAHKLTATDELMKDNIGKMVRSKQTMELLGQAAADAMVGCLTATCRDVLVPAFDRSCQVLFGQVNQTFQAGTAEYERQVVAQLERVRQEHSRQVEHVTQKMETVVQTLGQREHTVDTALARLHSATDSVTQQADALRTSQDAVQATLTTALHSMQERLLSQVRACVREEVQNALREHQVTAARSQAATPLPDPQHTQATIMAMLRQGQVNQAFQQALSVADLALVMWLCETVSPQQVFTRPCPLQQPILLSLIQQLSSDLNTMPPDSKKLDIKIKYLTDAVMNLNVHDPLTQDHMQPVLNQLVTKVTLFLDKNANHRLHRDITLLRLAASSMQK